MSRAGLHPFFFPLEDDRWLAVLRLGLGIQFALYCLTLRTSWTSLFGQAGNGLVSRELAELLAAAANPLLPKIGWLLNAGTSVGLSEGTSLFLIWLLLFGASCGLIAGFLCRPCAILVWFLHLCLADSRSVLSYGVDQFMTLGMFYLMLAPLPDRYSLDRKLFGRAPRFPELLGFFRRALQIHLCFIYFFGGLAKALGSGWWDGSNLWRALTQPPFNVLPLGFLILWKDVLPILGIAIWLLEMTYPIFIWPQRTRTVCLLLICAMHAGIGFGMGMPLFALVMIVLNLAAFAPMLPPKEAVALLPGTLAA